MFNQFFTDYKDNVGEQDRLDEKDRWTRRMTDPSWYSRDWSSGILTCDGPFGPSAEIFVQHHAFAEGMDTTGADPVYVRGAKRFILAFGSIDQVATLIERLGGSVLASAEDVIATRDQRKRHAEELKKDAFLEPKA